VSGYPSATPIAARQTWGSKEGYRPEPLNVRCPPTCYRGPPDPPRRAALVADVPWRDTRGDLPQERHVQPERARPVLPNTASMPKAITTMAISTATERTLLRATSATSAAAQAPAETSEIQRLEPRS
jgi:hypothetical protein